MVPFPLLTPQPFLRTRLPLVARLKARGPQGRLVLQGTILDRSGAFRSATQTPCTVWPRTVMRGKSRKVNSGHNSLQKSARRPEPSPRNPRFAAQPKGVAAQRKVRGVKRGQETMFGVLSPFVPAGEHRHPRPPKAATVHALRGRKVASTGCAAVSAEGLPSADGIKERADTRWGTICKMFTFEPLTQDEKTAYII